MPNIALEDYKPITDPEVWAVVGERAILPPLNRRRSWTNSRLVLEQDLKTTIPLLHVLAEHKYGPWDPRTHYPIWADMDWRNESLENVKLVPKYMERIKKPVNASGFPAGTPEYYRWYRSQNPDKVKRWSAAAQKKKKLQRADAAKLRGENNALREKLLELEQLVLPPGTGSSESMWSRLQEIEEAAARRLGEGSSPQGSSPQSFPPAPQASSGYLESDPEAGTEYPSPKKENT